MERHQELEIIKNTLQMNDDKHIVLNNSGWTSRVYMVNEGNYVFKFVKDEEYQSEFDHEIKILKLLQGYKFNVKIPSITWIGKNNSYIGFTGIMGNSISTEIINDLNEEQKTILGTQVGKFLKILHSVKYEGDSPNSENFIIEWFIDSFHTKKQSLQRYFSKDELEIITKLVTSFPEKSAYHGIEQVFCHGDLGYNNIILSENLEMGIIDFGDAGYLDKSYDFAGLEDDIMLRAAILEYGGDNTLKEKVAMRRQLLPLMEILFLLDRKEEAEIMRCASKMRANIKIHKGDKELVP